ncbi:MAG: hypothetical protein FDZ75_03595, partial [Actinobacteria bacterium]
MNWFNRLSIATKLALGCALLVMMALGMAAIGYVGMQSIMGTADTIAQESLPGIDTLRTFQAMQESMFTYSQGLLLEPAPDVAKEYKEAWKQNNADASAALDTYGKRYVAPANKQHIADMKKAWADLVKADTHTVALYEKFALTGDRAYLAQAKTYANTTENDYYNTSATLLATMIGVEQARAAAQSKQADADQVRGQSMLA